MKKFLLPFFIFLSLSLQAQKFVSTKQSIMGGGNPEPIRVEQTKVIEITGNNFTAELPDGGILKGTITLESEKEIQGQKVKIFKTDKGCPFVINEDNVFINLFKTDDVAYSFYLDNYVEPTEEETAKAREKQEKDLEEWSYNSHVKMFGKFSADCMREGIVKPGMKREAVAILLDVPQTINLTETTNTTKEQWVYDDLYIYIENGEVTAIQRTKELR
jgi:hypothetical protein